MTITQPIDHLQICLAPSAIGQVRPVYDYPGPVPPGANSLVVMLDGYGEFFAVETAPVLLRELDRLRRKQVSN